MSDHGISREVPLAHVDGDPEDQLYDYDDEDGMPEFEPDVTDLHETALGAWWMDDSHDLAFGCVTKAAEYGSGDLRDIGRRFWRLANRHVHEPLTDIEAAEIGCYFYLVGKIARVDSALQRGDWASDDTWLDIEVYAKMVRAARAGVWAFPDEGTIEDG